ATPASERTWSMFLDAIVAAGWDPSYGARLYRNLESLQLEEIEAEHLVSEGVARDRARLVSLTLERLRTRMYEQGATDEDVDEARRLLEDPATRFRSPITTLARARRPQSKS